ncbi:NADH-quinone oxidoreductase subunit J [Desulfovibrio ferrophilus]|uniref:NADH-quinone oxidoreductase subunit J n=1 Tax=Desulfovibrio ferrophilus TaxID=241368 RepID=A0A2Z6AUG1_9BACT|nr:NADH-quinone oxidoreductase subunit J [Desulfovibrio ferrophilus]BBD06869.1 NADH-ubiquinone/plastoquinone oxidoreductase chain 6 [Desulfovibrio ferrophilus]
MEYLVVAKILFALYAVAILLGGFMAVLAKSLVRAMVGLILTLFGVAGMYLLMNAAFIAFMQLLIYVGAVVILIFFAIMLTKGPSGSEEGMRKAGGRKLLFALLGGLFPAVVLGAMVLNVPQVTTGQPVEVGIAYLGKGLLEDFVLAFELISVVLLIAMAGAVLLGWERRKQG